MAEEASKPISTVSDSLLESVLVKSPIGSVENHGAISDKEKELIADALKDLRRFKHYEEDIEDDPSSKKHSQKKGNPHSKVVEDSGKSGSKNLSDYVNAEMAELTLELKMKEKHEKEKDTGHSVEHGRKKIASISEDMQSEFLESYKDMCSNIAKKAENVDVHEMKSNPFEHGADKNVMKDVVREVAHDGRPKQVDGAEDNASPALGSYSQLLRTMGRQDQKSPRSKNQRMREEVEALEAALHAAVPELAMYEDKAQMSHPQGERVDSRPDSGNRQGKKKKQKYPQEPAFHRQPALPVHEETTMEVTVPKAEHMFVVGPQGQHLSDILKLTGVTITVPPFNSPLDKVVLKGGYQQLSRAFDMMISKSQEAQKAFLQGYIPGQMSGQCQRGKKGQRPKEGETFHVNDDGLDLDVNTEGPIRINPKNYEEGYVPHPDGVSDILIGSFKHRNRALNGDVVAVEIFGEGDWKFNKEELAGYELDLKAHEKVHSDDEVLIEAEEIIEIADKGKADANQPDTSSQTVENSDQKLKTGSSTPSKTPKKERHSKGEKSKECNFSPSKRYTSLNDVMSVESPLKKHFGSDKGKEQYRQMLQRTGKALDCLPQNLPWSIPEEEFEEREDFRKCCIFTIDPATARDLDDALSCEDLGNGRYKVGVHIADVSYFVEEGTVLDNIAGLRSTSVYLVHKIEEEWFGRSIIRSCVKLAYDHAQGFIEEPDRAWKPEELPQISEGFTVEDIKKRVLNLHKRSLLNYSGDDDYASARMQNARYFCTGCIDDESLYHHYALNVPLYTHFTSPIRRYPDILVHRLLAASLDYCPEPSKSPGDIHKLADNANDKKTAAKRVGDLSSDLFFSVFVKTAGPLEERAMVMEKIFRRERKVPSLVLVWAEENGEPEVRQEISIFSLVDAVLAVGDQPLMWTCNPVQPNEETSLEDQVASLNLEDNNGLVTENSASQQDSCETSQLTEKPSENVSSEP
ncbi:DI3L2-like protein [Mya arenaria]|uniref:DI3L2-like protein n=1 Tax=Mya arenaria TaxID=6604 RepID=A0ABY7F1F7_MYAAR|nr:DI3L2-like protein [Mya arenaria]